MGRSTFAVAGRTTGIIERKAMDREEKNLGACGRREAWFKRDRPGTACRQTSLRVCQFANAPLDFVFGSSKEFVIGLRRQGDAGAVATMQSTGPLGLVVRCRARSVTADLEICCGCQFRDWATMPLLLHTHALATLPTFGNLGNPRRPLFGNVASFWQPYQCMEHFRRPVVVATPTRGLHLRCGNRDLHLQCWMRIISSIHATC